MAPWFCPMVQVVVLLTMILETAQHFWLLMWLGVTTPWTGLVELLLDSRFARGDLVKLAVGIPQDAESRICTFQ